MSLLVRLGDDGRPKIRYIKGMPADPIGYRGNSWCMWALETISKPREGDEKAKPTSAEVFATYCPKCERVYGWTFDFGQILRLRLRMMKKGCPLCPVNRFGPKGKEWIKRRIAELKAKREDDEEEIKAELRKRKKR
jgi:hypothetical protein